MRGYRTRLDFLSKNLGIKIFFIDDLISTVTGETLSLLFQTLTLCKHPKSDLIEDLTVNNFIKKVGILTFLKVRISGLTKFLDYIVLKASRLFGQKTL